MDLLIDTHIVFWLMAEPDVIDPEVLTTLADPSTSLWVSSASGYEVAQKVRWGKWALAAPLAMAWSERLEDYGLVDLPLTSADMVAAGRMPWPHRDPFDRMTAAQALRRGFRLVSADAVFGDVPGLALIPAKV